MDAENGARKASVQVWDWPLRAFHWLLATDLVALFVTPELGGNWMEWHKRAGYFALGLLSFRIVWGFVGGQHARFAGFLRGPRAILAYVRGGLARTAGHNPLGALSVLAMLAALSFQAITGLFANDDIMLEGPFAAMIGKETSDLVSGWHKFNGNVILALIALHLTSIAFYFAVKKRNLVTPMITGRDHVPGPAPRAAPAWLAPILMTAIAAALYVLLTHAWPPR